ncbi:MAG: Unknown protein [uncultured Sulfurovum sp.]|uniref:Lipoprotein n=1 Tax=uncultured Sulfurovum sp. TaxID=269237 RepID=A0A6S6T571_9BACT|nr:MAG: Unknown protein [uncultured Sulfurovum sp.]
MKIIKISAIALSAILLSACGGGSSNKEKTITEQIKERDAIAIIHNSPSAICTSQELKDELYIETGALDIIASSEPNTVNCEYYGRTNDGNTCAEEIIEGNFPRACVIAANAPVSRNLTETTTLNVDDISDTLLKRL